MKKMMTIFILIVRNKTIIGLKSNFSILVLWNFSVRNKTIIGLKFQKFPLLWYLQSVRNKTIIGLKLGFGIGMLNLTLPLEIRL